MRSRLRGIQTDLTRYFVNPVTRQGCTEDSELLRSGKRRTTINCFTCSVALDFFSNSLNNKLLKLSYCCRKFCKRCGESPSASRTKSSKRSRKFRQLVVERPLAIIIVLACERSTFMSSGSRMPREWRVFHGGDRSIFINEANRSLNGRNLNNWSLVTLSPPSRISCTSWVLQ